MFKRGLYQISFYKKYISNDKTGSGYLSDEYYISKFTNEIAKKYDVLISRIEFDIRCYGYIEFICNKKDALKIYNDVLSQINFMNSTTFNRANLFYELIMRFKYL